MSRRLSRGQRAHLLWLCRPDHLRFMPPPIVWPKRRSRRRKGCLHGFWVVEKRGEPAVPAFLVCVGCGKWERAR